MAGVYPDRPGAVEPTFPIELVALDIDGTLVGEELGLGERTIEAVRAAVARGVRISLATGRMASSAMRFAGPLGLVDPIVAYQGALIRAMPTGASEVRDRTSALQRGSSRPALMTGRPPAVGRLLRHRPLAAEVAREVIRWSLRHDLDPHVNHLERIVVRTGDPVADDYSAYFGVRAEVAPDLVATVRHPVTKILAVGEPGRPAEVLDEARRVFGDRAYVTISHPRYLEFLAPGVSKGVAVAWLARRAGVPLGRVLAIGDQLNDLEMLGAVGHGAAMPTAPDEVRRAARYLAPPLADEGAATLIEELVLAGPRAAAANARRFAAAAEAAHRPPVSDAIPA